MTLPLYHTYYQTEMHVAAPQLMGKVLLQRHVIAKLLLCKLEEKSHIMR